MHKKLLLTAMIAVTLGAVAAEPAVAREVIVQVAPPAPRIEVVPAPRRGYVWTPGYWNWRGGRHVWSTGKWARERAGYRYSEPRWLERDGRWYQQPGRWSRNDRDGDGVPNRLDRSPDNPRRK